MLYNNHVRPYVVHGCDARVCVRVCGCVCACVCVCVRACGAGGRGSSTTSCVRACVRVRAVRVRAWARVKTGRAGGGMDPVRRPFTKVEENSLAETVWRFLLVP